MTIIRGLPASGKSTKAKELLEVGNTVRINKDLLRKMLHCDKFNHRNEEFTRVAAMNLATTFLNMGVNVIIDDTNLNPKTVQTWKELAKLHDAKIEYHDMDTSIKDCIFRDAIRINKVGDSVITKMALQYQNYLKGERVVICDLDGTLCDINHRLHFARQNPKDWKSFFAGIKDDVVRLDVLTRVANLQDQGCKIMFVSARPENYREPTEIWLEKALNGYRIHEVLIMRESHDKRPDTEVKKDIYEKYLKHLNIVTVFDDRPSVIRMWREKGLNVIDVGKGEEF